VSLNACTKSLPFNWPALFGERPASWRRRRFINAPREQPCCLGSIPPTLRYRLLASRCAAFPSLSLIHSDSVCSALAAASRYASCSGSATRIVKNLLGEPAGSSFGLPRVSIIEVYQQNTCPQGVFSACNGQLCWYNKRSSWELCPNKKPPVRLASDRGRTTIRRLRQNAATLHSCTRSRPGQRGIEMARKDFRIVRDKFARDNGLPFGRLLSREYVLSVLEGEGHRYRSRVFCPLVTLWGWLSQSLSQDKSLNEAVSRILAHRVSIGLPPCAATSSSYSEARIRFPETVMARLAKEIGQKVHDSADGSWNWRGREVFLVDGTGFSMPDTAENQFEYPQADQTRLGLGFPLMRAVGLISLATGAVVDMAFAKHAGKGTGEGTLLRGMIGNMQPGSVLVADRLYPSFGTIVSLKARGVDLVSMSHLSRDVDFSQGQQLGPMDHIVAWPKPARNGRISLQDYNALPETILVREFCIEIDGREGGKEQVIVVTTMTDPSIPQKELSDLYWARWNCELDFRSIKHSLHMDVLRAKTPSMVRKEIWAHLLAYNLLRGTMTEAAKRRDIRPRQLSVKGTMQAVESFTAPMMAIDGNEAIYDAFLATVSAHRVGNRPGRTEPRYKKRRPAWQIYMTIPRHKSHRRLASQT
jgi:hypothetical protein